ncbi:TonB-dependent receptor [Pedobacter mucosus]|uniref:TonB-dependent receptor n=1 Tax=Pedobacter mucosus TaxID=2895286 RepID=UPI001EE476A3|nr:TonB-dependent receptor [Pedobacter mucosus]UKT64512.1 TonB-dependent receptor [Pedobacter mucosus]
MKQTLFCALFLCFSIVAFAQTATLSGRITNNNGQPVDGATVSIKELSRSTMTDDKGKFELSGLKYGAYKLIISSVVTEIKTQTVNINAATVTLNVKVKEVVDRDLQEVSIAGKTEKRKIETSGFSVAIIETKEASLRNLTTNELLNRTVGVRVRQNGGLGSPIEYNLNGMSGSAIGIFIDGTPISTFGQSFNLNNIPPAMIDRIEVYKGVLPSHLTGDYVGGAINVILKKDASANNITAAVSYGSFNTFQTDLSLLYRNKKSGFTTRASGMYTYTDNSYEMWGKFSKITDSELKIKRYQRVTRFNDAYRSVAGRFEAGFTDVKWADNFMVGYNISDTYNEVPHGITMAQPYVGRFQTYQAHVLSLTYNKKDLLLKGLALNVNAVYSNRNTYLQDTSRTMYNWDGKPITQILNGMERPIVQPVGRGQQGIAAITSIDREIINIRSNLAYTVAQGHKISINHSLNRTDRDDNDLLDPSKKAFTTVSVGTNNIFAFNYEAQMLNNKLQTNLLAKYTINQNHQTKPSIQTSNGVNNVIYTETTSVNKNPGYGLTVSYNLIPKLYIIGSTENIYLSPREEQLYGNPENNVLENLGLTAEKNVNYNIGFRYGMLEFDKHKLSLYGSAFWRNGFDKIALRAVENVIVGRESDSDIQTTQFINLGKVQSRGFEGEVNYIYDNRLNAVINFSKFNSLFKIQFDENGAPHSLYNRQIPNEPFFTVNGSVQYRFNNVMQKQAILNVYYNTGYVAPFNTVWPDSEWFTTPKQFYHDLGGSYRFPNGKIIVSLDLKNFLNAEVYDNFGVQKPGRGVFVKLNYTINNFTNK